MTTDDERAKRKAEHDAMSGVPAMSFACGMGFALFLEYLGVHLRDESVMPFIGPVSVLGLVSAVMFIFRRFKP